jgi:hypothetical protein
MMMIEFKGSYFERVPSWPVRCRPVSGGGGPVSTAHIEFRGVLPFPLAEFAEPILQVPVQVPATP